MTFFIILLTISQIIGFYLIFNKNKPIIKPKTEGIIFKLIPTLYTELNKILKHPKFK